MASPNPRKEALVTPSPPRFTSTTSPDQTVEPPMSSTATTDMRIIITGIQPQSSFSKTTPSDSEPSDSESTHSESSESDFYVPDNTEEFWAHDLHQAQKKITYVQATVDTNARISTYNLLVSGLEQNEIQQLLQKKHSGSRATFTDEQVLFQIMPGNARAIDRVLTAELCEGNGGGELPDDEIHVGRHWRHELQGTALRKGARLGCEANHRKCFGSH